MGEPSCFRVINEEFFEILRTSRITKGIRPLSPESLAAMVPGRLLKRSEIVVSTRFGAIDARLGEVESLFDRIGDLWRRRASTLEAGLRDHPGSFVHVLPYDLGVVIRRYGPFFGGVLVPDQFMVARDQYELADCAPDVDALVLSLCNYARIYLQNEALFLPREGRPRAVVVPTRGVLDEGVDRVHGEASALLCSTFLSQLTNRHLRDGNEFMDDWQSGRVGERSMDPEIAKILMSVRKSGGLAEYIKSCRETLFREQGDRSLGQAGEGSVIVLDLWCRLMTLERYGSDAYTWGQEAEAGRNDPLLYEWWFRQLSSRALPALSAGDGEDFMLKLACRSDALGFLDGVLLEDVLEFLGTDPVESLREDLQLSRAKIRATPADSLQEIAEESGLYIRSRIAAFEKELLDKRRSASWRWLTPTLATEVSVAVTLWATLWPPVSVLALLWSGSVYDVIKAIREGKRRVAELEARPIAVLARWAGDGGEER